jgi:hypothetical protein
MTQTGTNNSQAKQGSRSNSATRRRRLKEKEMREKQEEQKQAQQKKQQIIGKDRSNEREKDKRKEKDKSKKQSPNTTTDSSSTVGNDRKTQTPQHQKGRQATKAQDKTQDKKQAPGKDKEKESAASSSPPDGQTKTSTEPDTQKTKKKISTEDAKEALKKIETDFKLKADELEKYFPNKPRLKGFLTDKFPTGLPLDDSELRSFNNTLTEVENAFKKIKENGGDKVLNDLRNAGTSLQDLQKKGKRLKEFSDGWGQESLNNFLNLYGDTNTTVNAIVDGSVERLMKKKHQEANISYAAIDKTPNDTLTQLGNVWNSVLKPVQDKLYLKAGNKREEAKQAREDANNKKQSDPKGADAARKKATTLDQEAENLENQAKTTGLKTITVSDLKGPDKKSIYLKKKAYISGGIEQTPGITSVDVGYNRKTDRLRDFTYSARPELKLPESPRNTDTEVKALEDLIDTLEDIEANQPDLQNKKLSLEINVSRHPCPSCMDLMYKVKTSDQKIDFGKNGEKKELKEIFKNVDIKINYASEFYK